MMSLLVILLASIFIAYSNSSVVDAQQQSAGARVAPAIEEGRIDPGDVYTGRITITNLESSPRTYRVVTRDISKTTNAGVPVFSEPGEITGFELSQWITPSASEITLEPGEEQEVTYVVSVPEDASPGGHFGGIFFFADAERQRETGAGVGYQIGTIMNFRISGDIIEEAQIREFLTDKSLYGDASVAFGVEVENQGNVLIRPRGPIDITDMFGKKVAVLRINDSGGAVLPNQRRTYSVRWEEEGLAFGRYEAIVALLYGEEGRKTISAATSFWILPLRIIMPIAGTLIIVILLIYFGMRFYLHRRLQDMYRTSRRLSSHKHIRRASGSRMEQDRVSPMPRLAVVAIAILTFTMIFLAVLFFLFA
jgi:hypothetical protein